MKVMNLKHLSKYTLRTIIIGIVVILFFVGIVLIYYNMLYNEKRNGIIKDGKMAANQSADQFDKYLSTNKDMIKLTAYTLDRMVAEKKSDEEIQEYLVGQSTAIRSAVEENSTGLYGYINGRFFSGTRWQPQEGYDPVLRPWYIKPMKYPGQITILEPYTDVQSGNTMIALGKTLYDDVSVISVDVSLDQMQKLTEEAVRDGGSDIEMILTGEGTVVTHSDINEVGKNYSAENKTLGNKIIKQLAKVKDSYFEIDHDDKHYFVYDAEFQGDWHCISVHDATTIFGSLSNILVATILIVITIVITLGLIVAVSGRRRVIAEHAVASNEAKSAFLSNMSHEIRTPINAILGMNEMIIRESDDNNIISYSESVKTAGNTLLGIVNDILDFSKIEAGRMEILPVNYRLSSVLSYPVNMIKSRALEKGLQLKIDFDREIPGVLYGDEVRIKQIITNILINAVKYTERGSITFSVSYKRIEDDPENIMLNVSVKDTGIGIKEEDITKLFSEFERLEEKRNRNIEGTGLGMNITQHLLEKMGSTLKVESVYGEGSVFSFSLKQKVVSSEPLGDYEKFSEENFKERVSYRVRFRAPQAQILAVDDNPMNLMVFTGFLKQTKINIDTAERGAEGLELTSKRKYDIIFLDHMMPDKDGIETLHELKEEKDNPNVNTPVVCLTANAIAGARGKYLSEGFDDYLTKPIDYKKLDEMLLKYLPEDKIESIPEDTAEEIILSDGHVPEELKELKNFKLIDIETGIGNSGTPDAYMPLLKIFYESIDEKQTELENFYNEGDLKNYTIKVHALKSSARIIGATGFGEEAQALENAAKAGNTEYLRKNHPEFIKKFLSFREPLKKLFEKDKEEQSKPLAEDELMMTVYEELRAAADEMDCDRLSSIFKEMEDYSISEENSELWKKLKQASENYDYETILRLLA